MVQQADAQQLNELDQIDFTSINFDVFSVIKKHGRKQVFCGLARRMLDDSLQKMLLEEDTLDFEIVEGILV